MTPDEAAKLREPFPPESIGHLPKAGITLDYVGHAATTDRLLQVDPDWTWEPPSADELQRLPGGDGMWIKLTVCGVSRFGWGDGKNIKEWISDAIRNAAMRFGVALDLWSKEDLRHEDDGAAKALVGYTDTPAADMRPSELLATSPVESGKGPDVNPPPSGPNFKNKRAQLRSRCIDLGTGMKQAISEERENWHLPKIDEADEKQLELWREMLDDITARLEAPFVEETAAV